MKTLALFLSFTYVLVFAAFSHGATSVAVQVTAKEKASGKVVYQGKTAANGKFSTSQLSAGSYLLEFASLDGSGFQVALAGAKNAKQTKSKGQGLAFLIEVAPASKVSGQVTPTPATAQAATKSNANVRVINGKRYVWVRGEIGSHMGGKWIPEDEAVATNPTGAKRSATETLTRMQDLGGQGAASGR